MPKSKRSTKYSLNKLRKLKNRKKLSSIRPFNHPNANNMINLTPEN